MAEISRCRTCPAEIIWCTTVNGKKMPVDAVPVPDGNLILIDDARFGAAPPVVVNKSDPEVPGYTSHFATCGQADEWRRR